MILGKTYQEEREYQQNKIKAKRKIEKVFAWLPTELSDGRYVWFQHYYYVPCIYLDNSNEWFDYPHFRYKNRYATIYDAKSCHIYNVWKQQEPYNFD
jgi:hypothetical protein